MNKIQSPNFTNVKHRSIDTIILHHTQMRSANAAIERLCSAEAMVSAHYLIDKYSGTITQLVDDNSIAYHAGESYWRGVEKLNNNSIGIELDNDGQESFSDILMESLIKLLIQLVKKYNIKQNNVLGHLDIAPWRKLDPHNKFNWKLLFDNGFGVYPTIYSDDFTECVLNPNERLHRFGYDIRSIKDTILAFNTRFNPHSYDHNCEHMWSNASDIYLNHLLYS